MKSFFEKLEYPFLVEGTTTENTFYHTNLPYLKPMLRQIEWGYKMDLSQRTQLCQ